MGRSQNGRGEVTPRTLLTIKSSRWILLSRLSRLYHLNLLCLVRALSLLPQFSPFYPSFVRRDLSHTPDTAYHIKRLVWGETEAETEESMKDEEGKVVWSATVATW